MGKESSTNTNSGILALAAIVLMSGCASTEKPEKPSQIPIDDRYGEFKRQAEARLQKGTLRTDVGKTQCERAKADLISARQKGNEAQIRANNTLIQLTCKKPDAEKEN